MPPPGEYMQVNKVEGILEADCQWNLRQTFALGHVQWVLYQRGITDDKLVEDSTFDKQVRRRNSDNIPNDNTAISAWGGGLSEYCYDWSLATAARVVRISQNPVIPNKVPTQSPLLPTEVPEHSKPSFIWQVIQTLALLVARSYLQGGKISP